MVSGVMTMLAPPPGLDLLEIDRLPALAEDLVEEERDRRLPGVEARDAEERASRADQVPRVDVPHRRPRERGVKNAYRRVGAAANPPTTPNSAQCERSDSTARAEVAGSMLTRTPGCARWNAAATSGKRYVPGTPDATMDSEPVAG